MNTEPIKDLKEDQSWVVFPTHKGVAMVVMEKEDYADKALYLFADTSTYRLINKDVTTKLKNKLTQTLRHIKQKGGFSDHSYRKVYPTSAVPHKVLWPPQNT